MPETINTKETEHVTPDVLKCSRCGHEAYENPDLDYEFQSECSVCRSGQMMSWEWPGWKNCEARELLWKINDLTQDMNALLKVDQKTFRLSRFTRNERTVGPGVYIEEYGQEAPWMGPFGACSIKIWGMRQRGNTVEYGVGNEEPPIVAWVTKDAFYKEWPK